MVTPFRLAASQAFCTRAAARSEMAGVMPVQWNQRAPSMMRVEVELADLGFADGGVGTVVDDLARAHGRPGLLVIDAYALTAAHDVAGVYAEAAQRVDGRLAYFILRQLGDEAHVVTIVGQADGYISLSTAVDDIEGVGLHEAQVARRRQAEHDFAQCDNLIFHVITYLVLSLFATRRRPVACTFGLPIMAMSTTIIAKIRQID
jgi:hypothetical protein